LHAAALVAADPAAAVRRALAATPEGFRVGTEAFALSRGARLVVIAAGKAASRMALAALAELQRHQPTGVVVEPHPLTEAPVEPRRWPPSWIHLTASHPLPDRHSLAAGEAVGGLFAGLRREDVALLLLSGGASALVERPRPGLTLDDLRRVTSGLQRAGADVRELNIVRRALSELKGGGLARLAGPARVVTLAISDVVGDAPPVIASGPTVPSPTGPSDAALVLSAKGVAAEVPGVMAWLAAAAAQPPDEPPPRGVFRVVASNRLATAAVAAAAAQRGFRTQVNDDSLEGEASAAGRAIGKRAAEVRNDARPFAPPACLVFGGETTVTVRGSGRGGRNLELVLGAAQTLDGLERAAVFSFATDGIDGASLAAGAVATGDTVALGRARGLSPAAALAGNDSEAFFHALGSLLRTGATGTNVNDVAVALVYP
jgi:hydroxypyruvate reductase